MNTPGEDPMTWQQLAVSVKVDNAILDQPIWRHRGFIERWFSWPWRPFVRKEFEGTWGELYKNAIRRSENEMREALGTNIYADWERAEPCQKVVAELYQKGRRP